MSACADHSLRVVLFVNIPAMERRCRPYEPTLAVTQALPEALKQVKQNVKRPFHALDLDVENRDAFRVGLNATKMPRLSLRSSSFVRDQQQSYLVATPGLGSPTALRSSLHRLQNPGPKR